MKTALLLALALLSPGLLSAFVGINEVAWMGSASDANHEWIELFNDGSAAVSLDGWTLNAVDGAPAITLSGTIVAGGYFLLERTSDDSVASISADLIYTGALGNDGERLLLHDVAGNVLDSVNGQDTWLVGGNNATKETLQRISSGWGTGAATPRRANSASAVSASTQSASASKTKSVGGRPVITGSEKKDEPKPEKAPALFLLDIGTDRTVTEGAPVVFEAVGFDEDGDVVTDFTASWNFGDGTTGTGRALFHTYAHPGRYAVSVSGTRTRFSQTLETSERVTIIVDSPMLHIGSASPAFIEITNDAGVDTDLSGYTISDLYRSFTIPNGTLLLAGARVRFSGSVTGLAPDTPESVMVRYPGGAVVPGIHKVVAVEPDPIETPEIEVVADSSIEVVSELVPEPEPEVAAHTIVPEANAAAPVVAFEPTLETTPENGDTSPFSGVVSLLLIIIVGIAGALWVQRKFPLTEAGTFAIVEETEDNPKP
mgnify:FL=1